MIKRVIVRAIRSALVAAAAGWWSVKQNDPRWIAFIPCVQAAGKWIREKYPKSREWIPF